MKMAMMLLILGTSLVLVGCPQPFHQTFTISQDALIDDGIFAINQNTHLLQSSTDGGYNFAGTVLDQHQNISVSAVVVNSEVVYVAATIPIPIIGPSGTVPKYDDIYYLLASYDLGQTFVLEWRATDPISDLEVDLNGAVYATVESWGQQSGLWKKSPGGEWEAVSSPSGGSLLAVDVDPNEPDTLYVLSKPGGGYPFRWISESSDGGINWSTVEVNSALVDFDRSFNYRRLKHRPV